MTSILETDGWVLSLDVGDRIEYTVDGSGHRSAVTTAPEGQAALTAALGATESLVDASRGAAAQEGFATLSWQSIAPAIQRWCHTAGLSSDWIIDGRRIRREHVLAAVPQPGTGRTVTLSLTFRTPKDDAGEVIFTEDYRAPTEPVGYSYAAGFPYDDLPRLVGYLEAERPRTGELEDRLIAAFAERLANGVVDPLDGQGAGRDLVRSWCREAGAGTRFGSRGTDRRETLVQVETRPGRVAEVTFSIDTQSKQLRFQEGHGTADERWRDALYLLQFEYGQIGNLLSWLTKRVGPADERLGPDDALFAGLRVLAERGELTPHRPMQIRDRFAGWLDEAGVEYRSYGSAWREPLLRVHRPNDCIFTLSLTIDPAAGPKGITFTEFYDYGPIDDDPGREYGYSVEAPYDALDTLADAYAPDTDGPSADRLIDAFRALVAIGKLGDGLPLQSNQQFVLQGFEAAGVQARPGLWVWHNSD